MGKHYKTLRHDVWLPHEFAVGPVFERFYEGLKQEIIWGTKCSGCKKTLVPARTFCPECLVDMNEWVQVSQKGKLVSWTLANYQFYGAPTEPPFVGALIRLEDCDCDFLHLLGGPEFEDLSTIKSKLKKGSDVRAVWNEEKKGHMLDIKYFKLM